MQVGLWCCGSEPREPSYSSADLLPVMEKREGSRAGLPEPWAVMLVQWDPLELAWQVPACGSVTILTAWTNHRTLSAALVLVTSHLLIFWSGCFVCVCVCFFPFYKSIYLLARRSISEGVPKFCSGVVS